MVGSVVSESQFERFAAQSQSKNLVPQTNAEDRFLADKVSDACYHVVHDFRVARAVGDKDSIGVKLQYLVARGGGGKHPDSGSGIHQQSQDVSFDSTIVNRHTEFRFRLFHGSVPTAKFLRPNRRVQRRSLLLPGPTPRY